MGLEGEAHLEDAVTQQDGCDDLPKAEAAADQHAADQSGRERRSCLPAQTAAMESQLCRWEFAYFKAASVFSLIISHLFLT